MKLIPEQIKLTAKQIENLLKEGRELDQAIRDKRDGKVCPCKPRVGKCKVCQGVVTETYQKEFDCASGPAIIGPGSRSQFIWRSSGLFCQECGLAYHQLPKK